MFYEEVLNMVLNKYKYVSVRGCLLIYLSTFICMYKWVCVCCMCECRGGGVCVCVCMSGERYMYVGSVCAYVRMDVFAHVCLHLFMSMLIRPFI